MSNPIKLLDKSQKSSLSKKNKSLNTDLSTLYWLNYICAVFATVLAFSLMFGLSSISIAILGITALLGIGSYVYILRTERTLPRITKTSALFTSSLIVVKFTSILYLDFSSTLTEHHIEFATIGFLFPLILFHSFVAFGNQTGQRLMIGTYFFPLLASFPFLFGFSQHSEDQFIRSVLIFVLCVTTAFILIYIGAFNLLRKESSEKDTALLEFNYKDKLTDLANRTSYTEHLQQLHSRQIASEDFQSYALVLVDIDGFKRINDSYGQNSGDSCLRIIAKRLQNVLPEGGVLARTDGDEFTFCISCDDNSELDSYCKGLAKILKDPIELGVYTLNLSFTVAGCLFPFQNENLNMLLKKLAWTMSTAKQKNQSSCVYSAELDKVFLHQEQIENELFSAINDGEFKLHYQPLLNLQTGKIESAEALLRWQNKHLGPVSPADFIPIAEATGMILPIGDWVIKAACMQLKRWADIGCDFSVAINVSVAQFNQKHLVKDIRDALAKYQVSPEKLHLEITESQVVDETALQRLAELQQLGCTIKLDDFGTGYSSLAVVESLPLNALKIDKSFIQHLDWQFDAPSWMTVKTIITLAHNFNLKVVAEGVETLEQLEQLQKLGCDYAQGFYLAKPMSPESFYDEFLVNPKQFNYTSDNAVQNVQQNQSLN